MRRGNRRASTGGVVRDNRIGAVDVMRSGRWVTGPEPWYYRRRTVDGRVYTGPAGAVNA